MSASVMSTRSRTAAADKASVLAEAMPWLLEFHGATIVIKYGGHAMVDENLQSAFARDVLFLRLAGLRPVVVHGGGPQINSMLEQLNIHSEFVRGYRVTSPEVLQVVRMVLTGQVQRELVSHINSRGPYAVGVSGEDAGLFTVTRAAVDVNGEAVDIGLVGQVVDVQAGLITNLLDSGMIPIVSSLGVDSTGQTFNINADEAAAALATALFADKLVVLTDVEGLYRDWPNTDDIIGQIESDALESLVNHLDDGMVPKVTACVKAVNAGVPRAHIIDGRQSHALLLEIFTDEGIGTMVVPSGTLSSGSVHAAAGSASSSASAVSEMSS